MEAIHVEKLSKRFLINHREEGKYTSLRDIIAQSVINLGRRSKQDTVEEFWALKDIDFSVKKGERIGIIGRNGAGKSTLLKILSRITEPTSGSVRIKGRVASLLEVGTGFHPELTGRENIFLNGSILGMSRAEIRKRFDEIVTFAETEKFLDTPVKRYSSGMYVRLAFSIAAHLEPEILIVDEVLAVGDAEFQKKCLGKMEDVSSNEGRTVLFVSHNMGVVSQLCQSAILLNRGRVELVGKVKEVIDGYILNQNTNGVDYARGNSESVQKSNYFSHIYSLNSTSRVTHDFGFDESIILNFDFVVSEPSPDIQIGIGLNDKYQNRVLTALKPLEFFESSNAPSFSGRIILPPNLIAPGNYSFTFALWTKSGVLYDVIERAVGLRIYDTGTKLSLYEGMDYGVIVIDPKWHAKKVD